MTLEQRLDHVEQQNERILQQNQRIERKNKRLTAALTLMAVAMCAVVTVAATGFKDGHFESVTARHIWVTNEEDHIVVGLTAYDGTGSVRVLSAEQKHLVTLSGIDTGGAILVHNKTGERIVVASADEYGNGVVGAYNRKGIGRQLKPGP